MEEQIQKNKCAYCGKEFKNVPVHERFCKLNPEKAHPEDKEEKEHPKEPQQEQKPLIISNVMHSDIDEETDDLPWFEDANGNRKPEIYRFIGIHENIPCVLVMTAYGRLVPPYIVPGFIGMFPKGYVFPEVQLQEQPQEQNPTAIASDKPIISSLEEEKFAQVIPQEPVHAQTEKKQSILGRILGKKEKATTETTNSSADLAKRILEAQTS